jgi:acyl carrier protein
MEISNFIIKLSEIFEDEGNGDITPETNFKDLEGYSSIIALSIIAMADEEYNVRLKGGDISGAKTVADLFDIIKSRV